MKPFRFKQFAIKQDACAMKVSLDACIFGAICNIDTAQNILDIGTGTGLLSLMVAQRCNAKINAVELDVNAAKQAQQNIQDSPFSTRINVHNESIKTFKPTQLYDAIICNPPFFSDHLKSDNKQRALARHNDGLSFDDLCKITAQNLTPDGEAFFILPCTEFNRFMKSAGKHKLYLNTHVLIKSRPQKEPHRIIFSLKTTKKSLIEPSVHCIYGETGTDYSPWFRTLLADFYLKL